MSNYQDGYDHGGGSPPKPPVPEPPVGEYVFNSGRDTPENRAEAEEILRSAGCQRMRHEPLDDGRLVTHGYLRAD